MDKNKIVIEYLLGCPQLASNSLFFNAATGKDESKQIVTMGDDKRLQQPFIDGSVLKRYTFTIIDYKSISYQPIVKKVGSVEKNENVSDMLDTQGIIDWITEQNEDHIYPDFGEDCIVEQIQTTTEDPNLNGIDTSTNPPLAKYSISIQIDYMDYSKVPWKK